MAMETCGGWFEDDPFCPFCVSAAGSRNLPTCLTEPEHSGARARGRAQMRLKVLREKREVPFLWGEGG